MDAISQIRALLDQLEQGGAASLKQPLLPHADNPRESMPLTADGAHFAAAWWMEGYVGALAGVSLPDWNSAQFVARFQGEGVPPHLNVLIPDHGQATVSPADLGWIDASAYNPADCTDQEARTAAWNRAGRPTVGPSGRFDVHGNYLPADAWTNTGQTADGQRVAHGPVARAD